jgi:carbohydrate kinase (thermoresistant glucokinase family)
MSVVVMGVCGSGKTCVGRALADHLAWRFLDADDFHPQSNVDKMAAGIPLEDADRWPWLDRLAGELANVEAGGGRAVLACSALRQRYRDRLGASPVRTRELRWIYLKGDMDTISPRMASRRGHFMPASLLASQFAALEEPVDAIVIDVRQSIEAQVREIAAALQREVSGAVSR